MKNLVLLTEVKSKGIPLIGTYSYIKHNPHSSTGDYHLHIYNGKNQIFSINRNGTGHDGYSGERIPNEVYNALVKKFEGWHFPSNQIIETANTPLPPVESLSSTDIKNEMKVLFHDIQILSSRDFCIQNDSIRNRAKELFLGYLGKISK